MSYFFNFEKINYIEDKDKNKTCILCDLAQSKTKKDSLVLFRNTLITVSVNLYPYNPAHLLLFPSRHVLDIRDINQKEVLELHHACCFFMSLLDRLYSPSGYNTGFNMGQFAGASISHIHQHIIPRYPGELGMADILGGKKVLIESPWQSADRIKKELNNRPFQPLSTDRSTL